MQKLDEIDTAGAGWEVTPGKDGLTGWAGES